MERLKEKIMNKMAAQCSRREYCEYDIREKLSSYELSEEDKDQIVENLKKLSFINDQRFAIAYAKDKFRFNKWGKRKIVVMLLAKHIENEIIDLAIGEIDSEHYKEQCLALLESKAKFTKAKNINELKNKLIRYAIGRGFDYETSLQCISKITLQAIP